MKITEEKGIDLRFLIGLLFAVYGVILALYGLAVHPQTPVLQGWNIDFWWGLVSLLFGGIFLLMSRRPQKFDD